MEIQIFILYTFYFLFVSSEKGQDNPIILKSKITIPSEIFQRSILRSRKSPDFEEHYESKDMKSRTLSLPSSYFIPGAGLRRPTYRPRKRINPVSNIKRGALEEIMNLNRKRALQNVNKEIPKVSSKRKPISPFFLFGLGFRGSSPPKNRTASNIPSFVKNLYPTPKVSQRSPEMEPKLNYRSAERTTPKKSKDNFFMFTPNFWQSKSTKPTTPLPFIREEDDIDHNLPSFIWGDSTTKSTTEKTEVTEATTEATTLATTTELVYERNQSSTKNSSESQNKLGHCGRGPTPSQMEIFENSNLLLNRSFYDTNEEFDLRFNKNETDQREPLDLGSYEVVDEELTDGSAWPWMAAIFKKEKNSLKYWCGGSIIDKNIIISAAHCFDDRNSTKYSVRVGDYDLESDEDGRKPQEFEISEIIVHEDYIKSQFYNDVVILKLKSEIIYTSSISPVCIPPSDQGNITSQQVYVTGWGDASHYEPPSNILRHNKLKVMKIEDCSKKFQNLELFDQLLPKGITNDFFCVDMAHENSNLCQEDHGENLAIYNFGWEIIGIRSLPSTCSKSGFVAIYTRINSFVSWIFENIQIKVKN